MNNIRRPTVAGMFYPGSSNSLRKEVRSLLDGAHVEKKYDKLLGIVSPHAGYPYSGHSAAYAYNVLKSHDFDTAVIISPSHREYFPGLSIFNGDAYETPLGRIEINRKVKEQLLESSEYFLESIKGHGPEHAVEVQLPFLQVIKDESQIVPVVIGDQRMLFLDKLTEGLEKVVDDKTVIIVSSDLSHFYSKEIAGRLDSIVESHILEMDSEGLQKDLETKKCEACGGGGIVSLLKLAEKKGYNKSEILSRTDSGDASGDNTSVVGYLSAAVYN